MAQILAIRTEGAPMSDDPTPELDVEPTDPPPADPPKEPETDWAAEAKKWEKRAKDNLTKLRNVEPKAQEYDRLAAASQTAEERATEELQQSEARVALAYQKAARSEVKAALAAVVDNPDAILEDLDLSRFVDDEGDVDLEAVARLTRKYAGFSNPRKPRPDPSQASGANNRSVTITPAEEFADVVRRALTKT